MNFTLDMILPEFQQVEFDPLVLNISPYETWYDEKRSFFTEGAIYLKEKFILLKKNQAYLYMMWNGYTCFIISTPDT